MEFWDFVITFLAGAGVALLPIIVEKSWSLFNRIKYRKIIKTYTILTSEILAGNLKSQRFQNLREIIIDLARLNAWEQMERILTPIIKTMESTEQPQLDYYLSKKLTEHWIKKYWKIRKEKEEFIKKFKSKQIEENE